MPILSSIILIPLIAAILILIWPSKSITQIKLIAIIASIILVVANIMLLAKFNYDCLDFQFIENYRLLKIINLDFNLGIDGISLLLINLTSLLALLANIYLLSSELEHLRIFLFLLMMLQAFVIASFATLNILFFYIFFEIALVPMYFMIGYWGGDNRIYASYKFFIYTLCGSLLFGLCILYLYVVTSTFNILELYVWSVLIPLKMQQWLWVGIFISFAIKIPMLPFHTWLPDAHVQAPTVASVILAGVLLKLGGYGFIRILLPILPKASMQMAVYPMYMSVVAIIYASFAAIAQKDMKKMIAYSSIAHMGYVSAGIFSLNHLGLSGSVLQMLSHGLVSSALFFIVGILYHKTGSLQIAAYGGVAAKMPILACFFMIATLGAIGVPGTSGFIGEFVVLNGIFNNYPFVASIGIFGMLLSAIYMLGLYKNVVFGAVVNAKINKISDIDLYQQLVLALLCALILLFGLYPGIITQIINLPIKNLIKSFI